MLGGLLPAFPPAVGTLQLSSGCAVRTLHSPAPSCVLCDLMRGRCFCVQPSELRREYLALPGAGAGAPDSFAGLARALLPNLPEASRAKAIGESLLLRFLPSPAPGRAINSNNAPAYVTPLEHYRTRRKSRW